MGDNCWLCGKNGSADPLDVHHIFGGGNRAKSQKYGLVVKLCHFSCHIFGIMAVHNNRATARMLHEYGQKKVMYELNWTKQDFINEFGKNYLED